MGGHGELVVQQQRIPKSHHLEAHRSNGQIDLHGLRRNEGNTLDNMKTFLEQLVGRHHFVDQADAQSFLRIDMVSREAVAQRIFEARQESPHETCVGTVADLRLGEDGVLRGDRDVREESEPGAGAHGPTVDGADNRLAELP